MKSLIWAFFVQIHSHHWCYFSSSMISMENPHSYALRINLRNECFFCWCNVLFKRTATFKWFVIWSKTGSLCHIPIVCVFVCDGKPCNCHFDIEFLIRNLLFSFSHTLSFSVLFYIFSWRLFKLTPWHRWVYFVRDSWNHCWWKRTPHPIHNHHKVMTMKTNRCIQMMIESSIH